MMSQRQPTRYQRYIAQGVLPLVALFVAVVVVSPHAADPVRVLAAVTLKPALDAIVAKYGDGKVVLVYGPSPMLAKQVEDGVPADMFFSADKIWMDELVEKHLIDAGTNTDLVGNHLVLIARKGGADPASQWARSTDSLCFTVSGSPPTLQASARRATARKVSCSPPPAIITGGRGCCTGLGSRIASSTWKYRP